MVERCLLVAHFGVAAAGGGVAGCGWPSENGTSGSVLAGASVRNMTKKKGTNPGWRCPNVQLYVCWVCES